MNTEDYKNASHKLNKFVNWSRKKRYSRSVHLLSKSSKSLSNAFLLMGASLRQAAKATVISINLFNRV